MTSTAAGAVVDLPVPRWRSQVVARVAEGQRFGGVYCSHRGDAAQLHALLVTDRGVDCLRATLSAGDDGWLTYPALTPDVPAAFWYERALHDLSGVVPNGHPRLDPLLLPREPVQPSPKPGHADQAALDRHVHSRATERYGPVDVRGRGVFSLPLGPVRSGVYESIEFLIETAGEDIPDMNIRPHYKHRGIAERFETLKESIMRLVSALCGNRFGRSVVCVGGVAAPPRIDPAAISERLTAILIRTNVDRRALMGDATFLDRVRGTGHLDTLLAASHGAVGPVGRGSGCPDDARRRPYDGYTELPAVEPAVHEEGDALARLRVRWDEIDAAGALIRHACERLLTVNQEPTVVAVPDDADGFAVGWSESPQGEVLYAVELRRGTIGRCFARTASLHNMLLFHDVFGSDIFTDFPFIEASFGLCYAGVAM
jgi:Ni,Fe-hydrogenase III large subunit